MKNYLDQLAPYEKFERQVIDKIIELFECTNGDAQGIAEVNEDLITQGFRNPERNPERTAQIIFDYRFVYKP